MIDTKMNTVEIISKPPPYFSGSLMVNSLLLNPSSFRKCPPKMIPEVNIKTKTTKQKIHISCLLLIRDADKQPAPTPKNTAIRIMLRKKEIRCS